MFKTLIQHIDFSKIRTIAGVEVNYIGNDEVEFNLVVLKQNQAKLDIHQVVLAIKSFEELKALIPANTPISIAVTGKGIIYRQLTIQENDVEATLLMQILPNATIKEFYIQQSNLLQTQAFVIIARKNVIDSLLESFTQNKLQITELYLGPFCINGAFPLIEESVKYIIANKYKFEFLDNQVLSIVNATEDETESTKYLVGGEWIDNKAILALAAGFNQLVLNEGKLSSTIPAIVKLHEEFKYGRFFRIGGWGTLGFLFAVLLINYLVFDNYNKQNIDLEENIGNYSSLTIKQKELQKELTAKKDFVEKTGLLEAFKISYYADRLADGLPIGINFSQLKINPQQIIKNDDQHEMVFHKKEIIVNGMSKRSSVFNDWIKGVKHFNWVDEATILNYSQENANMPAIFIVSIKVK